ncbi:MAG: sensor histidine kinase [Acidobacteriota bacterium]
MNRADEPIRAAREPRLRRLHIEQSLGWAVAWALGLGCLFAVAVTTHDRLERQDLDAELRLHAVTAYGLTWFDEAGRFHDEALRRETAVLDRSIDLWVIEPDGTVLFRPPAPRFTIASPADVATRIVRAEALEIALDGNDTDGRTYRLHGTVTYDAEDRPRAAILAIADPTPWTDAHDAFVRVTALATFALLVVGLLVGVGLSRRALRPVLDSVERQERFLAAAAHELRTPIASLRAVCESATPDASSALDDAARLAEHTGRLVDALLLLARLDASVGFEAREPIRLDLMVEAALPEDGSVELDAEPSIIVAEPLLIETALRNLVENARRHGSNDDGHPAAMRVRVRHGTVTIDDDGPGFSATLLDRATEPFVASRESPGSGLGLAIVSAIARRHGGRLTLANRQPTGARVTLDLGTPTS